MPELEEQIENITDIYYAELLKDPTGKYMFISRRRVKWFLLSMIYLKDCTLTHEKLLEPTIKEKLLEKMTVFSNSIELPEYDFDCPHQSDTDGKNVTTHEDNSECLAQIKQDNLDDYRRGIREEIDLKWKYFHKDDRMSDEFGDQLTMYCYNGEMIDEQNNNKIYRFKEEWCSEYFVGEFVDKFVLKIMLYDKILLGSTGETFSSHLDSSPMSGLSSNIVEYLDTQYDNVVNTVGEEEAARLDKIRDGAYAHSKIPLTIFDVYRMFYVF